MRLLPAFFIACFSLALVISERSYAEDAAAQRDEKETTIQHPSQQKKPPEKLLQEMQENPILRPSINDKELQEALKKPGMPSWLSSFTMPEGEIKLDPVFQKTANSPFLQRMYTAIRIPDMTERAKEIQAIEKLIKETVPPEELEKIKALEVEQSKRLESLNEGLYFLAPQEYGFVLAPPSPVFYVEEWTGDMYEKYYNPEMSENANKLRFEMHRMFRESYLALAKLAQYVDAATAAAIKAKGLEAVDSSLKSQPNLEQ